LPAIKVLLSFLLLYIFTLLTLFIAFFIEYSSHTIDAKYTDVVELFIKYLGLETAFIYSIILYLFGIAFIFVKKLNKFLRNSIYIFSAILIIWLIKSGFFSILLIVVYQLT